MTKNWHHRDFRSCGKCGMILKTKFERVFDKDEKKYKTIKVKYCPKCNLKFLDKIRKKTKKIK